jgi:hypothetical protein
MKNILTILILTTINLPAWSQYNQTADKQKADEETTSIAVAYRLYPTQNMWTFIKLNTRTGQMWQVQYDVQGSNRFEVYLSLESLATIDNEANDRFTLYPTQNIYNFILVDQFDGRLWQVQWSLEAEKRAILPIE